MSVDVCGPRQSIARNRLAFDVATHVYAHCVPLSVLYSLKSPLRLLRQDKPAMISPDRTPCEGPQEGISRDRQTMRHRVLVPALPDSGRILLHSCKSD